VNAFAANQHAQLDLSFARRGDRTVLDRRLFRWPFVLTRTFHLDLLPAHMLTVILQTSSGAVHGEDKLRQRFHLGQGSAAHVTTQGATAVHRANAGATAGETIEITVGPGAFLEYLPEPRILFPDAALSQTIDVDCARGATAIFSDSFTVHDPEGQGRGFRRLESTTILRFDGGEPVMIDRLDITRLGRGRSSAFGNIYMVAPRSGDSLESLALALSSLLVTVPSLYAAASLLPDGAGIGARLAGRDLRSVRAGLELCRISFRQHLHEKSPLACSEGRL
jgi:urease accessory protein